MVNECANKLLNEVGYDAEERRNIERCGYEIWYQYHYYFATRDSYEYYLFTDNIRYAKEHKSSTVNEVILNPQKIHLLPYEEMKEKYCGGVLDIKQGPTQAQMNEAHKAEGVNGFMFHPDNKTTCYAICQMPNLERFMGPSQRAIFTTVPDDLLSTTLVNHPYKNDYGYVDYQYSCLNYFNGRKLNGVMVGDAHCLIFDNFDAFKNCGITYNLYTRQSVKKKLLSPDQKFGLITLVNVRLQGAGVLKNMLKKIVEKHSQIPLFFWILIRKENVVDHFIEVVESFGFKLLLEHNDLIMFYRKP
jgi:hypothetical protein